MAKLDIIIPVYNLPEITINCLKSIRKYTKNYRIILIDNNSEPENLKLIKSELKNHNHFLISNDENLGFVKATNQGLATSTAPFVVLLNNDTEVEPEWAEKLMSTFNSFQKCGLVGPLTDNQNSWQYKESIYKKYQMLPSVIRVNGMIAFFCAMIKREVIQEVGYLSEKFGIGFGDDDYYCLKAQKAGFEIYLRTDVVIKHLHRTTFKKYFKNWEELQNINIEKYKELEKIELNPYEPGLVSIIIPHKKTRDISKTLESINNQTYKNFEIIVVEDKDNNANITRNLGYLKAKGEFLFFCDDDIILEPRCLEELVNALKICPDASFAYCNYRREGNLTGIVRARPWNFEALKNDNYISTMSLIRHKDFPPEGFDPNVRRLQDWDLWLRIGLSNKRGVFVDDILFTAIYTGDGITETEDYIKAKNFIKQKFNLFN